jgi:hypothetical protein
MCCQADTADFARHSAALPATAPLAEGAAMSRQMDFFAPNPSWDHWRGLPEWSRATVIGIYARAAANALRDRKEKDTHGPEKQDQTGTPESPRVCLHSAIDDAAGTREYREH